VDIEVIRSEKNFMEFYIVGETHTFCNVLRSALEEDPAVKKAAYTVEHPLTHRFKPRFEVGTDGRVKPSTVLKRASQRIVERCEELREEFERELGR